MVFDRANWQKKCKLRMQYKYHSYATLSAKIGVSKATLWNWLNKAVEVPISQFLLISRLLDVNALEYIIKDEVQLPLF